MYTQHRYGYYSTASRNEQHKIAFFATRVVLAGKPPLPSPLGEGRGVSFRAADHKRAAETSLALISQRAGPLTASPEGLRPQARVGVQPPQAALGAKTEAVSGPAR